MIRMNSTPDDVLKKMDEMTVLPLSVNNSRDLGGLPLMNGRKVKKGLLLRTTDLYDATEEDIRILTEDYHLSLILDMRSEFETSRRPDPEIPGVKHVMTPIIDFSGMMKEDAVARKQGHQDEEPPKMPDPDMFMGRMIEQVRRSLERDGELGLDNYTRYLRSDYAHHYLGIFFHEIAANDSGASLFHCYTGKDRTGIASGLLLSVLGASYKTVVAEFELSNLYFADRIAEVEAQLREKGIEEYLLPYLLGSMAGVHHAMLDTAWHYFNTDFENPAAFLKEACGITEKELNIIRERYIE